MAFYNIAIIATAIFFQLTSSSGQKLLTEQMVIKVLNSVGIVNPVIVGDQDQFSLMIGIGQSLNNLNQSFVATTPKNISLLQSIFIYQSGIWISQDNDAIFQLLDFKPINTYHMNVASRSTLVIVSQGTSGSKNYSEILTIDQEVYFLNVTTLEVTEAYSIGDHSIDMVLGRYDENFNFVPDPKVSGNPFDIVSQRSNFHGKVLTGLVEAQPPYNVLQDGYKAMAKNKTEVPNTFEVIQQTLSTSMSSDCL